MPARAMKTAQKELSRLQKMSPQMPEYPMLRHYLELLAELPWNKASKESIHLNTARMVKHSDYHSVPYLTEPFIAGLGERSPRHGERQGSHLGVLGCQEAQELSQGPHLVLCWPAGCWED